MARTPAQRGRVGNWLVDARLSRGWDTQEQARTEIQRLTGWRIPQSVYAEWESGRRVPSEANLERLRGFYGDGPTTGLEATLSLDAVVAAIHAQADAIDRHTAAVTAILEELREGRAETEVTRQALTRILGALAGKPQEDGRDTPVNAGR